MPTYRATIRHGAPRQTYEVVDVEAATLQDVLVRADDWFPVAAAATADLIEVRRQTQPDERTFTPS
jgi:hypothetical protein